MAETGALFDEFVQGGLLDDADVTIKTGRFVEWDYGGKIQSAVLALKLELEDGEGNVSADHLSGGELKFFRPSSDGKKALPVGNQTKLNINTNAVAFLISLINADTRGELAAKIRATDDISVIDGVKVHIIRKDQPKRSGLLTQPEGQGGLGRKPQQLQVERLIAYPWEAAGAPAAAGATTATAAQAASAAPAQAAAAAPAANALDDTAVGVLVGILAGNGNAIKSTSIAGKVFAAMGSEPAPVKNGVLALVVKPDWLGAPGRPWSFDRATGMVSLQM